MVRNLSLVALSAVLCAASVTHVSAAEKKQLYFVANGAVDFWKLAEAGMKKAQAELPGYTMEIKYPEQASAAVQNRLLDDLVANGASGIILSAVDPKTQTTELDKVAGQSLHDWLLQPRRTGEREDASGQLLLRHPDRIR